MEKNILLRTNTFVCAIIIIGFAITSVISYNSNKGIFTRDVEHVSSLTSEGIYHQIDSIFTKPVNVSLTMANDSLLKDFLSQELQRMDDSDFIGSMRDYLLAYREKYGFDSVFLVSTATNRYYHYNGIDRVLTQGNPENVWYYDFLEYEGEYSLNIDNDEAANNEITVFINCMIKSPDGLDMGVVGVGFRVDFMQDLLKGYENEFGVHAYLVNGSGDIEISTDTTGYRTANLFSSCPYPQLKDEILASEGSQKSFWYSHQGCEGYVVACYVPNLDWYLIIDYDTSTLSDKLNRQFAAGVLVVMVVIGFVLLVITRIIKKYNDRIVRLAIEKEQEHRNMFQAVTEHMYENIYELDITHNKTASAVTEEYFRRLGVPDNTPYDEGLKIIAQKQIRAQDREGYITTFSTANVLKCFEEGIDSLRYDFMITNDGFNYYWMRITARIFYWKEDGSIRMFTYRQNIDAEKRQEKLMLEQMQRDALSGLYNKAATQEHIRSMISKDPDRQYAFFIVDIDDFKSVNDRFGHAVGDSVIEDFSLVLKEQFRPDDIVGRIGGDEFVVFIPAPSRGWVEEKAKLVVEALNHEFVDNANHFKVTASVGIAIAPYSGDNFEALYRSADAALYRKKELGKNGYTIAD